MLLQLNTVERLLLLLNDGHTRRDYRKSGLSYARLQHTRKLSAVCICSRRERGAENNVVTYLEYTPANRTAPATTMMVIVLCTMRIIIGTTSTLYYSTVVSTYVLHSADCRSQ